MIKNNLWQKMFHPDSDPKTIPSLAKRIHRYAEGVDYHLANLKYVLNDLNELKQYLYDIENLKIASDYLKDLNIPYNKEFQRVKKLLERWPNAVNPSLICRKKQEFIEQAHSITDVFLGKIFLDGLKFLDFGCGKGYVCQESLRENPLLSVGYDIKNQDWDKIKRSSNLLLTTNWEDVLKNKPYDVILLYDVFDHIEKESHEEVALKIKQVLSPDGTIFIRCHPWCSRHGTHLYQSGFNKAFAHIIFDSTELTRLGGYLNQPTVKILNPIEHYKNLFISHNFFIENESYTYTEIENFFFRPEMVNRINKHWESKNFFLIPDEILSIEFIDYELKHSRGIL